jgi:hypothetical protein
MFYTKYFLTLVHIKLSLDLNPMILTFLTYSKPKKVEAIISYIKKNIILARKLAKSSKKK